MSKLPKLPKGTTERLPPSFGSFDSFDRGGGEPHFDTTNLCVECRANPRLASLARCSNRVKATAEVLHLDERTVTRGIQAGDLPSVRVGRRVLVPRLPLLALLTGESAAVRSGGPPPAA